MNKTLVRKLAITSILLETAGIILLAFVLVSFVQERAALAQPVVINATQERPTYSSKTIHGTPVSVSVPSVGVDTSVVDGYYDAYSGRWSITEESAFFATITDEANSQGGSTFIYGHNSDKIFGNLRGIKEGALATVRTDNGYEFTYRFTGLEHVAPTEGDKLDYEGKPRLVLQTCSGFWNETRQLTYFTLESFKKI